VHLIIGGKYMGKLAYARALYGEDVSVCDLADQEPESMFEARVIVNLQDGARSILKRDRRPLDFFEVNLSRINDKILIGDEIGSGIVPLDPFERLWRDETGFLYQFLAARADLVDRVWAGIPSSLKG
jgi:adenosyl cobinamide kinase/adenosyl cobinamide phosphate guanylyltransferase